MNLTGPLGNMVDLALLYQNIACASQSALITKAAEMHGTFWLLN
jgi:hypothetical protein